MLESYKKLTNNIVGLVNKYCVPEKKTANALAPKSVRISFLTAVKIAGKKPFVIGQLSEASRRLTGGRFLVTRAGAHFAFIKEDDIDIFSEKINWSLCNMSPPQHIEWHRMLYRNTKAGALLICYPLNAQKLWMHKISPDFSLVNGSEEIIAGYAFSKESQSAKIISLMQKNHVLLVEKQAVLAWGTDLMDALARVEALELICALTLENISSY